MCDYDSLWIIVRRARLEPLPLERPFRFDDMMSLSQLCVLLGF